MGLLKLPLADIDSGVTKVGTELALSSYQLAD
jgi:hypothetical protein